MGEYVIGCAELCGLGHYRMRGTLQVVDALAFDRWNESGGQLAVERETGTRDVAAAPSQHSGH